MNLFAKLALPCCLLFLLFSPCQAAESNVKTWIDRASESASEITDPDLQSIVNDPLARTLARSGEVVDAVAAAKGITDPLPKMYVLTAVAKAAHQAGNTEVCRQVVEAAKQDAIDNAGPFYTQAYIELCFAAGLPDAAMEYADKLFKSDRDPTHYQELVEGFAASSDVAAAEKLLEAKQLGDYGKYYLVKGLTAAKKYDEAIQIADSISVQHPADRSRSHVATALAHEGQKVKAIKQAALLTQPLERNGLLGEVELFSSRNDTVDELRKSFAAAATRDTKTKLLGPLVQKLVAISALDEADQAIDAAVATIMKDPRPMSTSKFGVYGDDSEIVFLRAGHVAIADKLIEQNKLDKAAEQLAKFEPLYDVLPEEAGLVKWPVTTPLIKTLVQLGELDRAEEKLASIQSSFSRVGAAVPLAVHYIKSGDVEKGLQFLAANEEGKEIEGLEYGEVALALLDSVSSAKAAEFLESLTQTDVHGRAITDTARDLVESKRLEELEELYSAVKSPFVRTLLATEAANRMLLETANDR